MASTHAKYVRLRLKQYSKYRDMMGNRFSTQLRAVKIQESKKCHNSTSWSVSRGRLAYSAGQSGLIHVNVIAIYSFGMARYVYFHFGATIHAFDHSERLQGYV